MANWENTRVLLTGGTGFLGVRLVECLVSGGVSVTALVRRSSDVTQVKQFLSEEMIVRVGPGELGGRLSKVRKHSFDAVINLATAYGRNGESDAEMRSVNDDLPAALFHWARSAGVPLFLQADTYFDPRVSYEGALGRYVTAKGAFRQSAERANEDGKIRFASVRIHHMYGPGDASHKFVPRLVASLVREDSTFSLTSGEQRRDFVFVDDVARAFRSLVLNRTKLVDGNSTLDVGTGLATSIRDMALLARELSGSRTRLDFGALRYREGEEMESVANCAELLRLGWSPRWSLREGLQVVVDHARTILGAGRTHVSGD